MLVFGIIILFISAGITPSIAVDTKEQFIMSTSKGITLYVGGTGEGNYTKIQDAIDDANDGDTVFVYDEGSPYNESILIDKSLNLIGEDKNTTVIGGEYVKVLDSNNVNIQGFMITVGGEFLVNIYFSNCSNCTLYNNNVYSHIYFECVVIYDSSEIKILNNYILYSPYAIWLTHSHNCIIENNHIKYTDIRLLAKLLSWCIHIDDSTNITVIKNHISRFGSGISSWSSNNIKVIKNHISRCIYGINIVSENNITVKHNQISGCVCGIKISPSAENVNIVQNNFILNIRTAVFGLSNLKDLFKILWDGNYWGRLQLSPRLIFGWFFPFPIPILVIPVINFDWHPAKDPYNIEDVI